MKRFFLSLFLVLSTISFLSAGKGKLRVGADREGAYIYIDGKKRAMTGEGFTSILIDEGEHTIKVVKPKSKTMAYMASKRVFVGADTSTKIFLKLSLNASFITKLWEKRFDVAENIHTTDAVEMSDGNIAIVGYYYPTKSTDLSISYILKIDKDGNKLWDKTLKGKGRAELNAIIQSSDGNLVVAGCKSPSKREKTDFWIVKLDSNGNKISEKIFGTKKDDNIHSISQSRDGGFIIGGSGTPKGRKNTKMMILKLDKSGNKIWSKSFGKGDVNLFSSVIELKNGDIVGAGVTYNNYKTFFDINMDCWIVRLNSRGKTIWSKIYGGKDFEYPSSVIQIENGNLVVVGDKHSKSNDYDMWIFELNKSGHKVWSRTFGGEKVDGANSIIKVEDGFIVAGRTSSKGAGDEDIWIVKIDKSGNRVWDKTFGGADSEGAKRVLKTLDGNFVVVGSRFMVLKFKVDRR